MSDRARKLQAWEIGELSLSRLLSAGRKARTEELKPIRIAVLGEAATQHYCLALKAAMSLRGWLADIYEAEYDTIRQEAFNPESELYSHNPDVVILMPAVQGLWHRYCGATDKIDFAKTIAAEWSDLRAVLRQRSKATVVQHNYVVPLDRTFGNATAAFAITFASAVTAINADLSVAASKRELLLVDTEFQAAYHGKRHWLDERLWCQAKQAFSPAFLPHLAKAVSDVVLTPHGIVVKCVVVDLDNTMWGGILAEDGANLLEMGQTELGLAYLRFQLGLAQLKQRGILLAICSKNDFNNVLGVLDNHPDMVLRRDDFATIVANFDDKATNLMTIREQLNIGYDSMVFLDDTPFERDLVRTALPQIQVPELSDDPANFLADMARWNLFEALPSTDEDLARSDYYRANIAREEIRASFQGLDDFIADLRMTADILPLDAYTLPRAQQLVMRSNQFNLTTIRYNNDELAEIANDREVDSFCIRLADRLGDNGIVAFVILRKEDDNAIVDTWIMSCRVLGRRVEELTIQTIVEKARNLGCRCIIGRYSPTPKNGMVAALFTNHGFEPAGQADEMTMFSMNVDAYRDVSVPISINMKNLKEAS